MGEDGFYYQLFQNATWWILGVPPCIAIPIFVLMYRANYLRHTARIRTKMLIKIQTRWLKNLTVLYLLWLIPVVAYGTFTNELRRLIIYSICYALTYYAELHWLIRLTGGIFHLCIILIMETYYFREYLIQLACWQIGQCKGGSNFDQLIPMKEWINDGSVLRDGSITLPWLECLFWRSFFVLIMHYMTLIILMSLEIKIRAYGPIKNEVVPDVVIRPPEDTATMFAFIKQAFYHKTLAYTQAQRRKNIEQQGFLPCFNEPKKKRNEVTYAQAQGETMYEQQQNNNLHSD